MVSAKHCVLDDARVGIWILDSNSRIFFTMQQVGRMLVSSGVGVD